MPNEFRHFIVVLWQVNGFAPQLWSIISTIVFSALQTQGFGIHFVYSFAAEIAQVVRFSYVDDCDIIQSDYDTEATHLQMQLEILEWE